MKLKHKLVKEFQYLSDDKKIIILKVGSIIEEYLYKINSDIIPIDKVIVDSNPDFFQIVNWKEELIVFMKKSKIPQPAVLSKKLIPFIDEMFMNNNINLPTISDSEDKSKELEFKELDLLKRVKRIIVSEEDIELRRQRIQKREDSYKQDIILLDSKEQDLMNRKRISIVKELEITDKLQEINNRERNLENEILNSNQDIEGKYVDLQLKINKDLKLLEDKEKALEVREKSLIDKESDLIEKEDDIDDKFRDFNILKEDTKQWASEVYRLSEDIREWESLNWKLKRFRDPPKSLMRFEEGED